LAALRRAGAQVTLLAPSGPGGALVGTGTADVDRLLPYERADYAALFASSGGRHEALRSELAAFDLALVYSASRELARRLGDLVPKVVTHDPAPPPASGHAADWLARPVLELGMPAGPSPVPSTPTAEERAACASIAALLPPRFLAVHPGSGSPRKNWPAERFAGVVARLSPDRPWLLVEGPADAAPVAELARIQGACRAQGLAPRILGALLGQAGVYVGNDSGVTHLAAAWGAPTLGLFGPTSPDVWGPLGPRVGTLRSPTGDMDGIELDAVVTRLREWATCSAPARPSG
jgi:ADP-heptose:LPS heptosyltransferase